MTLTEMLTSNLKMEPECDADAQAIEDTLTAIKDTLKEWLRTVRLPSYDGAGKGGAMFNTTESLRQLLIALVDEP